jgi:aryl-alcohol dehydrogenase-like predicted oxidoreductase
MIRGYADLQGTIGYFNKRNFRDNWSVMTDRYRYSKLGLGTFLGDFSDENSRLFRESITHALLNGVNFIDTAINYRGMRSERDIGFVVTKLIEDGSLKRNQFIVSTKAGIIPGDGEIMFRPINYMNEKLIATGILNKEDVYMEETLWLTMNPKYFEYALDVSRKHLNLETIDIYYMHELELSMRHYGAKEFYHRLKDIIISFENMINEGKIREYGMATWDAFQLEETHEQYISLEKVMEVIESVTTKHHFKHLMLPINIENRACVENKNQSYKQSKLSIVECANKYNLDVHVSGPLGQGKANNYATVKKYLEYLVNESQCNSYFIGSKNIEHLKSNIEVIQGLLDK